MSVLKKNRCARRIDTIDHKEQLRLLMMTYVRLIKRDKDKFDQFINFLTINVSEFYRNPDQWTVLEEELFPELIKKFGKRSEDLECCLFHRR